MCRVCACVPFVGLALKLQACLDVFASVLRHDQLHVLSQEHAPQWVRYCFAYCAGVRFPWPAQNEAVYSAPLFLMFNSTGDAH
jgi:hypothetical protein